MAVDPARRQAPFVRDAPALAGLVAAAASWVLALVAFEAGSDAAGWSAIVLAGGGLLLATAGMLEIRRGGDRTLALVALGTSLALPVLAGAAFLLLVTVGLDDVQIGGG